MQHLLLGTAGPIIAAPVMQMVDMAMLERYAVFKGSCHNTCLGHHVLGLAGIGSRPDWLHLVHRA